MCFDSCFLGQLHIFHHSLHCPHYTLLYLCHYGTIRINKQMWLGGAHTHANKTNHRNCDQNDRQVGCQCTRTEFHKKMKLLSLFWRLARLVLLRAMKTMLFLSFLLASKDILLVFVLSPWFVESFILHPHTAWSLPACTTPDPRDTSQIRLVRTLMTALPIESWVLGTENSSSGRTLFDS